MTPEAGARAAALLAHVDAHHARADPVDDAGDDARIIVENCRVVERPERRGPWAALSESRVKVGEGSVIAAIWWRQDGAQAAAVPSRGGAHFPGPPCQLGANGPDIGRKSARRGAEAEGEMALTHPATLSPAGPADSPAGGALASSAAIICLNEAACIGKCLQSLGGFAEIIVVDSGSTDRTLAIVDEFARRGFPIRLVNQPWLGYARQKQFALDQATQPWVFSIDADEWLDDDLRAALPRLMAADDAVSGLEGAPLAHPLRATRSRSAAGRGPSTSCASSGGAAPASTPRSSSTRVSSPTKARRRSRARAFCATNGRCRSTSR